MSKDYLPFVGFKGEYNRYSAVNYADIYAHGRNANFPSYGTGCSCTDCTNFASQVLFTGGVDFVLNSYPDQNAPSDWWVTGITSSRTWRLTDWFRDWMSLQNRITELVFYSQLSSADIILLDLTGPGDIPDRIPDHARVVVGYGYTSTNVADYGCLTPQTIPPSTYTLLVDQHCTDRRHVAWDFRINENQRMWFYHINY